MNKYLGKSCNTLQRDILWSPLVPGPTLTLVVSPRSPTTADRMLRAVYQRADCKPNPISRNYSYNEQAKKKEARILKIRRRLKMKVN